MVEFKNGESRCERQEWGAREDQLVTKRTTWDIAGSGGRVMVRCVLREGGRERYGG